METILYIIILLLVVFLSVSFYTIWNLLRKLEKSEDYLVKLSSTIEFILLRLKRIDERGIFESDDEIGWFFEEIKKLGDQLDQFRLK